MSLTPGMPTTDAAPRPHVITPRSVASWVVYDLANTIFSMNILTLYFALYVRGAVGEDRADGVVATTTAIAMAVMFVLSPLLGALTDQAPRRVPFLIASTLLCVGLTALLGGFGLGPTLVLFVLAVIAYEAGLQFYDALLPEVSTPENRGRIGGLGIGVGYLGSFIGIGAGLFVLHVLEQPVAAVFPVTAGLFLLFAWPAFVWVRERGNPRVTRFTLGAVGAAARQVVQTFRHAREYPGLLRFLIGRVFYTDAINTVVFVMGLYVVNVAVRAGQSEHDAKWTAQMIMLVAIGFAVAGGFVWGRLTDRIGPKRTLLIVLCGWIGLFIAAALIGLLNLPLGAFYVLACATGLAMGGTWAADRPLMLRLTPPDRVGEFYGLYGMVGRFAAITGPGLWAFIVGYVFRGDTRIGQPVGVLALGGLVLISLLILWPVSDRPGQATPLPSADKGR
jgi:UMF1 family MFS transporter